MVGVEFDPENNEVVGKVYDAESQLKYASEPRDIHVAGTSGPCLPPPSRIGG
jgi:hypothetical protein